MTTSQIIPFLLFLTITLDLILNAAKIGFTNSRFEKLFTTHGEPEKPRARALALLSKRSKLVFQLQTSHVLLRFMLAGLITAQYLLSNPEKVSLPVIFGILAAAALIIALLEQLVEARILPDPEKWSLRLSGFTRYFLLIFSPVLVFPLLAARVIPAQPKRLLRVTEEELNLILDAGQLEGVLEMDEREMINSIFSFRETMAREIMVPRIDLLALNADTPLLKAIDSMLESGYSRVPVYEGNIDVILGVLYIKDLLRLYRRGKEQVSLREHLRAAYFIPETKKVGELLAEMQAQRNHLAIVVDEYGGVAGIATLEDIVEEIVGEIQDEYDQAEEILYQQVGDNEFLCLAKIDINDFNQVMGTRLSKETADTLGGLLYSWFGRVPKPGETMEVDDILFTVEQVTGRRIRSVRAVHRTSPENIGTRPQDTAWYWKKNDAERP